MSLARTVQPKASLPPKESAVVVALLAGASVFAFQLVFGERLSSASQVGSGLLVLATVAWVAHAMYDRICRGAGAWLAGKPYSEHSTRLPLRPFSVARPDSRRRRARARDGGGPAGKLREPIGPDAP